MIKLTTTASILAGLLVATGCTSSSPEPVRSGPGNVNAAPQGRVASQQLPPPSQPPSPQTSASQNNASQDNDERQQQEQQQEETASSDDTGDDSGTDDNTQVASLEEDTGADSSSGGASSSSGSGSGGSLSRNSVLGAYKVTAEGGNCQIILSLTEWTGGYRAASRGCPGAVADVSAWDVSGNQVQLKNSSGSNIASLSQAGGSRYEGSIDGGGQISLYR